jgi:precorrin-8X/cobalt-precorrin-8 methylmutase
MEWHITDAQSLSLIEQDIQPDLEHRTPQLSLAETVIVQRVIYATGDTDYLSLLQFSPGGLDTAAAALAAHTTLVVDGLMVQAGIAGPLQRTFANPIYCGAETLIRPQTTVTQVAWGVDTLARRFPEAMFVLGEDQTALPQLVKLIKFGQLRPAMVIDVAANFFERDVYQTQLRAAQIPYIVCRGRKGGPNVAVAIIQTIIELAWKAYGRAR